MSKRNSINYNHDQNTHTLTGPPNALPQILEDKPNSILDVGCGTGTWLKAAQDWGVKDIFGIDGIEIPSKDLLMEFDKFKKVDLRNDWSLDRRFDVILCLEVGEHLDEEFSRVLIKNLTTHSSLVLFSAACPGQPGQHHVNCRWPEYWQSIFNSFGFSCSDDVRWRIWNDKKIEPWYRQNMFVAHLDEERCGMEERLKPVIHPDMLPNFLYFNSLETLNNAKNGGQQLRWYCQSFLKRLQKKMQKSN